MTITTIFVTVLRRFKYLAEKVMYSNHYNILMSLMRCPKLVAICLFSPGLSCKRAAPVFRPEELLRTFAGEPREDPEVFIADIEAYFDKVGAVYLTPCHQILVAYRQLCGDVEKRNRYYKNIDQRVEELWDRLRRDYGADSQSQQLLATFMGATYKKTESFIDGQAQLYRRLFPRNTEKQLVAELIRQMPPTIRGTLAVGKYSDLAHFTEGIFFI
jgi:hypothetical protein